MTIKELVLGVDIGGTNTVLGLVDSSGNIAYQSSFTTAQHARVELFVDRLCQEFELLRQGVGPNHKLLGIGIGAPNANHFCGTIEYATNLPWPGRIDIVGMIKQYYPEIPITITNDAKAAAMGEMMYGGARGMNDFVVITLGTGLGSGFVINGHVLYGSDSFAGELGHVIVEREGRLCGCGRRGCLETYSSATGLKRSVEELLALGNRSSLQELEPGAITAKEIDAAARAGDPVACQAFEIAGTYLGRALANAVAITSPEAIFLFGGLANAGDLILEPVRKHFIDNLLCHYAMGRVRVMISKLQGKNAAVLGSAALVWKHLLRG